ncbi:pentatricopeptide repeat-containing protein At1g33350 [Phalaenopsis equestris]|uniref:pentatricopeptide repeat-containing protein At1g33350 n=1 Tax=Phalaenopsis equestris TaxID=78828 RepID=UPI0009E387C5|nr:pentatricopeptide repeat-containing protein At1g33350 [Phalaenopsis equestris]
MSADLNRQVLGVLEKCARLSQLKQLQAFLTTLGHSQTQFFAFKLLRFCSMELADFSYSRLIFDSFLTPNVYLYTAMLTAYSSLPDPTPAFHLFSLMLRRGCPKPNEFIYPHALKACSDQSAFHFAKSVHGHASKTGFDRLAVVQTSVLDAYARFSDLDTARKIFDELSDRNVVSWTALISGYARVGRVGNAIALFEEMPERDVPSWNAMIAGCTQNGMFSEAVTLFRRMQKENVFPNDTTVTCMLSACGHLGVLQLGKWIHGYVMKNQIKISSFIMNALIDMYGKCGSMKEAGFVFQRLFEPSLTSWNSMINCLALHGHNERAIAIFKDMERRGARPDEITFVGLLNACTHAGLVDEGMSYFNSMRSDHGIEPKIEHFGCVVDLLCRAGRFEEAMGVVRDMKLEPDEVIWGSFLNGCKVHGNFSLAEFSVKKLIEIDPKNVGYGVMLANLYSKYGKWEEVGEVRKVLKDCGGKKLPGCSWIEVDSWVHQFYSGDKLHPEADEICVLLEELAGLLETSHELF